MNRWMTLAGFLGIVTGLCSYILPELTGKTVLTKLQVAVIVIGGIGNAASSWHNLISPSPNQQPQPDPNAPPPGH